MADITTENTIQEEHPETLAPVSSVEHADETHTETVAPSIPLAAEELFQIGNFGVTNSFLMTILTTAVLITIAFLATKKVRMVPGKMQNFMELVIEGLASQAEPMLHDKTRVFLPLLGTFFLFIITANYLGLFPGVGPIGFYQVHDGHEVLVPLFRGINADLNVTLALALISVVVTQWAGIRYQGLIGYVKHYFHSPLQGGIIMVIGGSLIGLAIGLIEIVSEFTKVASLSLRLFGNIFAGENLLTTISGLFAFGAPVPFMLLEVLVGFIQATIFFMLTLVFISIMTTHPDEESAHEPRPAG
jgi:F-type H+-transporting ATPase subunit a